MQGVRGGQEVLVYNSVYSTKRNSSTQVIIQLHNFIQYSWMNDRHTIVRGPENFKKFSPDLLGLNLDSM